MDLVDKLTSKSRKTSEKDEVPDLEESPDAVVPGFEMHALKPTKDHHALKIKLGSASPSYVPRSSTLSGGLSSIWGLDTELSSLAIKKM